VAGGAGAGPPEGFRGVYYEHGSKLTTCVAREILTGGRSRRGGCGLQPAPVAAPVCAQAGAAGDEPG